MLYYDLVNDVIEFDLHQVYIDGLVQKRHNSIAKTLELRLSCTKPSTFYQQCEQAINPLPAVSRKGDEGGASEWKNKTNPAVGGGAIRHGHGRHHDHGGRPHGRHSPRTRRHLEWREKYTTSTLAMQHTQPQHWTRSIEQ